MMSTAADLFVHDVGSLHAGEAREGVVGAVKVLADHLPSLADGLIAQVRPEHPSTGTSSPTSHPC
eukprot:SAG22_NODE_4678_length_1194_cov_1.417352_2_plen_65_part_00